MLKSSSQKNLSTICASFLCERYETATSSEKCSTRFSIYVLAQPIHMLLNTFFKEAYRMNVDVRSQHF